MNHINKPVPKIILYFFPLAFILLFLAACMKDDMDFEKFSGRIQLNPSLVMPLAHGNLTLGNILYPDDSYFSFDPDNSIRLVMREDSLLVVPLHEILELSASGEVSGALTAGPVGLDDFSTSAVISLNDIAGNLNEPEASFIQGSGGSIVFFPELSSRNIGNLQAETLENIEYAHFTTGEIELTTRNNLPVPVSMEIRLVNMPEQTEVARFTFQDIGSGNTASRIAKLEDAVVRGSLSLEVLEFNTPSSNEEVYIDLAEGIEFDITGRELMVIKGKARMNKTLLGAGSGRLLLDFANNVELRELNIKEGRLNYSVDNYSGSLLLDVELTGISREGEDYRLEIASDGSGGRLEGVHMLTDMDFDQAGNPAITLEYTLYAGSENRDMAGFDFSREEVNFDISLSDIEAGYASGYLGKGEFLLDVADLEPDFDLFRKVSGDLRITSPSIRIFYENSGGVPSELVMNMSAVSNDGLSKVSLFDEPQRSFPLDYPDTPYTSLHNEIKIDGESSNVTELLGLAPSKVSVNASILINSEGNTDDINFITSSSRGWMGIEFEMPLDMQFTDLVLTDTVATAINADQIDVIETLFMNIKVENAFPAGAAINLKLYDSVANRVLYDFEEILLLEPALVNDNGTVIDGSEVPTETEVEIMRDVIDNFKHSTHIIISARLNTGKNNDRQVPVKFMTTDRLDFKIRLKAGLKVGG